MSDVVQIAAADQSVYSKAQTTKQSAYERALQPKMPGGSAANNKAANKDEDLLSPDIVDIKTMLNESQSKQQQETGAKK